MFRVLLRRIQWPSRVCLGVQLIILLMPPFQIHESIMVWFQIGLCVVPATRYMPHHTTLQGYVWAVGREALFWPVHLRRFCRGEYL